MRRCLVLFFTILAGLGLSSRLSGQGPPLRLGTMPVTESPGVSFERTSSHPDPRQSPPFKSWGWGNGFGLGAFGGSIDLKRTAGDAGQQLLGFTAGFYFGHGTILRGYYWRGINDGWDTTEPIQGYGGEAQFDFLGTGPIHLFLLAGGGNLDFLDGYTNDRGEKPRDTGVAIGGGGLVFELFKWMRLDLTLRDYLIKVPLPIEGSDSPLESRQLKSNPMLTGGLTFRLGGTPSSNQPTSTQAAAAAAVAARAANTAIIPVPINGEIRVTYGPGRDSALARALGIPVDSAARLTFVGTAAAEAVRSVLSAELGYIDGLFPETAQLGKPRAPITGARLDTLNQRLRLRMNEVFDHVATQEAEAIHSALVVELGRENITGVAAEKVLAGTEAMLVERMQMLQADSRAVRAREDSLNQRLQAELARKPTGTAYLGPSFGEAFQFVLGGQIGLRSWTPALTIVPEAALGFADGTSALIGVSGHYVLKSSGTTRPYAGLGIGLVVLSQPLGSMNGSTLVFTPKLGVTIDAPSARKIFGDRALGWMVEYQGVNWFTLNRLLFGARWRL